MSTQFEGRLLLLKDDPHTLTPSITKENAETGRRRVRIRCPRCGWQPGKQDRWMCVCLHVWNTFETGGRCPGCGQQWRETQCLRCHEWSLHADWYVEEDDG